MKFCAFGTQPGLTEAAALEMRDHRRVESLTSALEKAWLVSRRRCLDCMYDIGREYTSNRNYREVREKFELGIRAQESVQFGVQILLRHLRPLISSSMTPSTLSMPSTRSLTRATVRGIVTISVPSSSRQRGC